MKRTIILSTIALAIMATPALADMAGNTVYYNSGTALYKIPDVTNTAGGAFVGDAKVGNFGAGLTGSNNVMTDIAFDTDGSLYGISFGSMYSINKATGAATNVGSAVYPANALANYAAGKFYAAVDGTNLSGNNGHFYDVDWGTKTWTDKGRYTDASGTQYLSGGDIWVTADNTVYATINNSNNSKGWLATVNPANAVVTMVAPLPPANSQGDLYGVTQDAAGNILVYENNPKNVYRLSGNTLVDTGINTLANTNGATAVPAPGALLLGLLGLSAAGIRLRRFA
jgi:hypothetical protein